MFLARLNSKIRRYETIDSIPTPMDSFDKPHLDACATTSEEIVVHASGRAAIGRPARIRRADGNKRTKQLDQCAEMVSDSIFAPLVSGLSSNATMKLDAPTTVPINIGIAKPV